MDQDELRKRLKAFMAAHGLKPYPWATKAGLAENTLATFLASQDRSMTARTLQKLAEAANVSMAELIGPESNEKKIDITELRPELDHETAQSILMLLSDIKDLLKKQDAIIRQNSRLLQLALTDKLNEKQQSAPKSKRKVAL